MPGPAVWAGLRGRKGGRGIAETEGRVREEPTLEEPGFSHVAQRPGWCPPLTSHPTLAEAQAKGPTVAASEGRALQSSS